MAMTFRILNSNVQDMKVLPCSLNTAPKSDIMLTGNHRAFHSKYDTDKELEQLVLEIDTPY